MLTFKVRVGARGSLANMVNKTPVSEWVFQKAHGKLSA